MKNGRAYIQSLILGPNIRQIACALNRKQQAFLDTEVKALSDAVAQETLESQQFEIVDFTTGILITEHCKLQMEMPDLDAPDGKLVFTLLSSDGGVLQDYPVDIDKEVLGSAGLRVLACRIWSHVKSHQTQGRIGNSRDTVLHERFDQARAHYHDEAVMQIEADMTATRLKFQIEASKSFYKRLAAFFFIAAPYFVSPYDRRLIVNPVYLDPEAGVV